MSARADILGWAIRRLSKIDAADPVTRAALFETVRAETAASGACGVPPIGPPAGPASGDETGPFADHVYETLPLAVPGSTQSLQLGWTFDPACILTAHCAAIGFDFRTGAATFADAAEHLARTRQQGGLSLPEALRTLQGPA